MDLILHALNFLNPEDLNYSEWVEVGMALKEEGYPASLFDEWSRNDSRYKEGECYAKWDSFNNHEIKGGTIVKFARDRGMSEPVDDRVFDFDYEINEEDKAILEIKTRLSPTEQLMRYLEVLFTSDEYVGFVSDDVYLTKEGEYKPLTGMYKFKQKDLIKMLKSNPSDLGAAIGDYKKEAGAWIHFNPLDGEGVSNSNVTRFDYALVECDKISIEEQYKAYRKFNLPIAALVYSGDKSLHAIVKVNAKNADEYKKRVNFLYGELLNSGLILDLQNKNPSRLSRMPGVTRGTKEQSLLATNIGAKDYDEWLAFIEDMHDDLADFEYISDLMKDMPPLAPELIEGLLRKGHKMIVSGASKAGKSFFLLELAIALSEGREFLNFKCQKSNVLYVNLEIDRPSCALRIKKIYDALGIKKPREKAFSIWNLRGHALPLDKLVPKLVKRCKNMHFDCIIIDPIYKVITGDENNASEMGYFCNQFDKIADETGASVVYAHHHSKGGQGQKIAQDRSSGSGVFARDPDTIVDIIELELDETLKNTMVDSSLDTAWQLEFVTREFAEPKPIKIWFKYPLHIVDGKNILKNSFARGDPRANLKQYKEGTALTIDEKIAILDTALDVVGFGKRRAHVRDIAIYIEKEPSKFETRRKMIYKWVNEMSPIKFVIEDGVLLDAPQIEEGGEE